MVATPGTFDVRVYNSREEEVYDVPTVTSLSGVYSFNLPFFLVTNEDVLRVHWKFNYSESGTQTFERDTYVEIVAPILPLEEIKALLPDADDEEIMSVEKAVRTVINAHCGQTFGSFLGAREVYGRGDSSLRLPTRLARLDKINGVSIRPNTYRLKHNGYIVQHSFPVAPSVRGDYHGYHVHTDGVIHNPYHVSWKSFVNGVAYNIEGLWGWETVPEAVQEAARLLIGDYSCQDSSYRDRYLVSMTAADWRIQFSEQAYLKTGNARADQLLAPYRVMTGLGVV